MDITKKIEVKVYKDHNNKNLIRSNGQYMFFGDAGFEMKTARMVKAFLVDKSNEAKAIFEEKKRQQNNQEIFNNLLGISYEYAWTFKN